MKKENTIVRKLHFPVVIGDVTIKEIYFDLLHIRFGWDSEKRDYKEGPPRNHFTSDDVIRFFEQLSYLKQIPISQRLKPKMVEKRFVFNVYDEDRKFLMVVDLMKNEITVVVTIYEK